MSTGLVARSFKKMKGLLTPSKRPKPLDTKSLQKIREQLQECADSLGGEVSARQRASRLGETYLGLNDKGRHDFLHLIATEFGPDPARVDEAHADYQKAIGTPEQWDAESRMRQAMRSSRVRILTQFNALPQGVRFLVDLRVDLLRFRKNNPALASLDRELENRLNTWFDVGFLELRRLTWQSPAALLEKLIQYEAVHTIQSWTDLKNRLDSDRRCYAFFHPRMPDEPLIFVEVALTNQLVGDIQTLLDIQAPVFDTEEADTATFYSISSTQDGLRGVSFGNFLLKRVIDDLKRDFPQLSHFTTLSPLPTFRRWAEETPEAWEQAFLPGDIERISRLADLPNELSAIRDFLKDPAWTETPRLSRPLQNPLTRLAAIYLLMSRSSERLYDPVARFHLGNGARIERLNFLADTSERGVAQSYGMMVNYLYDPDAIEENVEALLREGRISASAPIRYAAKVAAR